MPKSELISSVEKISERMARKVLKECKFFGTMGTWVKTLQDENRILKRRVEELEIRVKKLNDYGPTPITPAKRNGNAESGHTAHDADVKIPIHLTRTQVKRIRTVRGFSQSQFALLLGVTYFRYNNWESGNTALPAEFEQKIKEIRDMKASDLRTRMQNVGIFQPNGKPQGPSKKDDVNAAEKPTNDNHPAVKTEPPAVTPAVPSNTVPVKAKATTISPEEIKTIRDTLGITQYEIAKELKIKETRYKNWEQGRARTPVEFIGKIRALAFDKVKLLPKVISVSPVASAISSKELRTLREELGLTRREMADVLKIKKNRYCNWEYDIAHAAPEFVQKMRQLLAEKKKSTPANNLKSQGNAEPVELEKSILTSDFSDILNSGNVPSELSTGKLREIRAFLKLTQRQLAELLNIKESRYTNWECGYGRPSADFVRQILNLLAKKLREGEVASMQKDDVPLAKS